SEAGAYADQQCVGAGFKSFATLSRGEENWKTDWQIVANVVRQLQTAEESLVRRSLDISIGRILVLGGRSLRATKPLRFVCQAVAGSRDGIYSPLVPVVFRMFPTTRGC